MKCDRATVLRKWTPTFLMLTSLLLLCVPGAWVSQLKGAVLTVVCPVDSLVAGSVQFLARLPGAIVNSQESPSQIAELESRVLAVTSERDAALAKVAELNRVLDSLMATKAVLGDAQLVPTPVEILEKPAMVMAAHQGLRGTLLISAGRISGIMVGDPVVYAKYVVGRVISAGLNSSQVQLVTDPGFSASAVTFRKGTEYTGGVEGTVHGESGSPCVMKHVLQTDNVYVDDLVLTSGLAGVFPRGFIIGRISKITSNYDARFQRVEIEPAVMPNQLQTVVVLVKKAQDEP